MSGGPKKHTQKHSLRALQATRERKAIESRAISSRSIEGDPEVRKIGLWSEEVEVEFSAANEEYHKLCKEYVATQNVSRKADILRTLRKMRKDCSAANKKLSGQLGVILLSLTNPAEDWTDQKLENALAGFHPTRLEPNPYGSNLEFNYSPQVVTPWDAGFFVMQLADPNSRPMMKELMEWCFAYPSLLAILDKMRVALKSRQQRPKFDKISGAWQEAVKHQKQVATLTRMRNLPDPMSTEIDETKSSGYPYSIMWQPGSHSPMDKVWHLTGSTTRDPVSDRLEKDVKSTLSYLVGGKEKEPNYDKRLLMYCLQAGNVKHILREEYGKKPDRGIYSAPLVTRLIAGAISQPFAENWYHPGDVTAESFMYGGAARIVAKMTGKYTKDDTTEQSLEKVLPLFDLKPVSEDVRKSIFGKGEWPIDHHIRELHLKEGRFAFPDKKWYDLMLRGEFMRDFAVYTDGVLPKPDDLVALSKETDKPLSEKDAVKKVKAWMKVNKKLHHVDRHAAVVTNRRYLFKLDGEKSEDGDGNPSGSPWTTKRNTWSNLCEEDTADVLINKKMRPNRDIEWSETPVKAACGDDLSLYWAKWAEQQEKEWQLRKEVIKEIGHEYKEETCKVSSNLSEMEFLGRRIFAYCDVNGKVLGLFGVRPVTKVLASVVYPKHMPPKAASMDAYGLARLIAANDEVGLLSSSLRDGLREVGNVFQSQGVKPVHDDYEEDLWWSPPRISTFRDFRGLMNLHLGGDHGAQDSPGISGSDTEDEDDDSSFSDDDLAPLTLSTKPPAVVREGTEEAKKADEADKAHAKGQPKKGKKQAKNEKKGKAKAPPASKASAKAAQPSPGKTPKNKKPETDDESSSDVSI